MNEENVVKVEEDEGVAAPEEGAKPEVAKAAFSGPQNSNGNGGN